MLSSRPGPQADVKHLELRPLQGHEEQGGVRVYAPSRMQSVKDMPGQTQLKFRCSFHTRLHC